MAGARACGITPADFAFLAATYRRRWGLPLRLATPAGKLIGDPPDPPRTAAALIEARRLALAEALRWGEPTVQTAPAPGASGGLLLWAVPLLHNARLTGGLVAASAERRAFARPGGRPALDIRAACTDLRRLAEAHNLTNAALLEARRAEYRREQERAQAIHAFKDRPAPDVRALYLVEEPALLAALRRGDRGDARAILNRLLVGMIHRAGPRLDLAKSFFMELVVMLCRTAVEAGGAPEELLGANYASLTELAAIDCEERLAPWLHAALERVMDGLAHHGRRHSSVLLAAALRYLAEHSCEPIGRADAARAAGLAPAHLSRLLRRHVGRGFPELLARHRVDRAADLLLRTAKPLALIALETGFGDQSYFTKVFRRYTGRTPREYRRDGIADCRSQIAD